MRTALSLVHLSSVLVLLLPNAPVLEAGPPGKGTNADPPVPGWVAVGVPKSIDPVGPGLTVAPSEEGSTDEFVLTWLEPVPDESRSESEKIFRLRLSTLDPTSGPLSFGEPRTVATGDDFWPNWADVSGVVALEDEWFAHRLRSLGEGTYDYGIDLLRSPDRGVTWESLGFLHEDRVAAEHGFVSYAAGDDEAWAFWLDGREMPEGGAQSLRATTLGGATIDESALVDPSVCECCPTAAAMTDDGPVVVYRDRSKEEIRDIHIVRKTPDGWSDPMPIHVDAWQINGCPVNGPSIGAVGRRVWVSWFTGAHDRARVSVALSHDGGAHFERPSIVDDDQPIGRVSLALDESGNAWLSWLARDKNDATSSGIGSSATGRPKIHALLRVARVTPGGVERVVDLSRFDGGRSSGIPRVAIAGDKLVVAWLEGGTLRSSMFDLATGPREAGLLAGDQAGE